MARFLHLSDLHVVAEGGLASGVLDTRAILTRAVDTLLAQSEALGPLDAVLVSGDLSDDGSADSYAHARAELERLGLPCHVVPGNHDAREPFRAAFPDPGMPATGPIDWRVTVGDTAVIGLDTLVEGQGGGRLSDASLRHLSQALAECGDGPVVVMLHHPPLPTGIRFMDAIGLENAGALVEALTPARTAVTILAGHVHGIHLGRIGPHHVVCAPSVCSAFPLDRRATAPVGFMAGPTGCAVLDTAPEGSWSAISLDPAHGPFPF